MLKQYFEAKAACPGALLLFRMGDFYELFEEDAKTASSVLGLTLTSRDKGPDAMPMAGFPYHQLDSYIGKLITAGYRAAVCEQVEDPKKVAAGAIVKREVVRIVTPGTVTEEALLDPKQCNYLAAILPPEEEKNSGVLGMAWIELSTGGFWAGTFPKNELYDQLARIGPTECLILESTDQLVPETLGERIMFTKRPGWAFGLRTAKEALLRQFKTATLEGFGFNDDSSDDPAIRSAGAILDYLNETQKGGLAQVDSLIPYRSGGQLEIDEASRRSLEITETIRNRRREGSLLYVLDKCMTSMGSRLLGEWVANPLTRLKEIVVRQDAIAEFLANDEITREIRDQLRRVADLQRLLTRVLQGRANPRDVAQIGRTLRSLPCFREKLAPLSSTLLKSLHDFISPCEELADKLDKALIENCPVNSKDGNFIRTGFHEELDKLRDLQSGGKQWIAEYQYTQSQRTGIPSLKISYNRVFGYYIEISNTHADKIPSDYHRKQTLKNAERYITPELKEYEEKVLTAGERANELESRIFDELLDAITEQKVPIQRTAHALAHLDVLAALATLARDRNYCRPQMVEEPILRILDGRHPVLEASEQSGTFVPNDARVDKTHGMIQLITGPNMAGKSTYIRQVALLTLMSQIGSFIPAKEATIGIADRIFARVGASDEISRGQSTFMVEMTETARILNRASGNSLVILDEIGRGTSTYDGISLAWAITEYLHDHVQCRTFFATHYHELTDLTDSLERVTNMNVAVREWNDEIAFLHKIIPGAADKSYGIHVARLAGVPREVIARARDILTELEKTHVDVAFQPLETERQAETFVKTTSGGAIQFSLFGSEEDPILEELRQIDLNRLAPLEALKLLSEWKQQLENEAKKRRRNRKMTRTITRTEPQS
ncbi:MAG: DNA mismatch repair protein MutS [Planctomycetaceae bacterium]|nr:DNA mismatch repair protein MutS [Planctomycetaceae bacterium]